MRTRGWIFVLLIALPLAAGCSGSDEAPVSVPTYTPRPAVAPEPTATLHAGTDDPILACPAASGEGTVSPAVSIYSITFLVDGVEQVVLQGDRLLATPGDEMRVTEVVVCAAPFSGNGGEACVDFVPVDRSGEEILSEHGGGHLAPVRAGFATIPGPPVAWTIDESWQSIAAVVNHWPPKRTEDPSCADSQCEHDDRVIVGFR